MFEEAKIFVPDGYTDDKNVKKSLQSAPNFLEKIVT